MKRILILLITFLCFSYLLAQEPISVRNQSTGNSLQGDWDLIFDSVELNYINGTYFFTSLADFNANFQKYASYSYYGEVSYDWDFNKASLFSELPLGVAFENPFVSNLKHAFLLRLRNSTVSEEVNGGLGEVSTETADYSDTNSDGIYDTRILDSKTYRNFDISKRTGFVLNNSYNYDEFVFGFKFAFDEDKTETDEARLSLGESNFGSVLWGSNWDDYCFELSSTNYLLDEDYANLEIYEKGDFSTIYKSSETRLNLSAMKPVSLFGEKPELRFDIDFNFLNNGNIETDDNYSGNYTKLLENAIDEDLLDTHTGEITHTYKYKSDKSGLTTKIKSSLKNITKEAKNRNDASFWEIGLGFGLVSGDFETSSKIEKNYKQESVFADTLAEKYNKTYSETDIHSDKGDYSGLETNIFARYQEALGENILFALGFNYAYSELEYDTDYIDEKNTTTDVLYGSAFDNYSDASTKLTEKITYDRTVEQQIYNYQVPVGLEFKLPKEDLSENDMFSLRNFCFRVGTTYLYKKVIYNDKKQVKDSNPETVVTEYGNGEFSISIDDNYSQSKSTHTEDIDGRKLFTGGIGYEHSDNLQIDAGGYWDEEGDNYYIGISFSVKR